MDESLQRRVTETGNSACRHHRLHLLRGLKDQGPRAKDKIVIGGKGAKLAEMAKIGMPLPLCCTIAAARAGVRMPSPQTEGRIERQFGAGGFGLRRTEHMFFEERRLAQCARFLPEVEAGRRRALAKLLPKQRADFAGSGDDTDQLQRAFSSDRYPVGAKWSAIWAGETP